MFNRLTFSAGRLRGCRLYSRPASGGSRSRGFDKAMIKPALIVIVFGSMLSHVSNQQKLNAELDRRYELKMNILRKLISRANEGDTNFDVSTELDLVNKLFDRSSKSSSAGYDAEAGKSRQNADIGRIPEETLLNSLNNRIDPLEEESLERILENLMNEVNDTPAAAQEQPKLVDEESDIVKNKKFLEKQAERETRLLDYVPSTDAHTIVDTPGELSVAANETEIKKFL